MSYDLVGKKILICVNVEEYKNSKRNRHGSDKDFRKIVETFEERVFRSEFNTYKILIQIET